MAGQQPLIPPLPQAPPVIQPPPGRVLLANLVTGNFYTVIHRNGPGVMRETFTGRFVQPGTTQPHGNATAIFNNLNIPNQPPILATLLRTVMDADWYYVPLHVPTAAPAATVPIASRKGGKRTKVQRKKRKSKKSRKTCRK